MHIKFVSVLLTLLVSIVAAVEDKNEPMVAFLCNRPSMFRTERGWMKDDNTGCLRDPVDILNYCRKVYPHLDVRNVVESNEKVTIDNWCSFGHKSCRHQFTVRPFRCLVGPFQSDALLVPEHCIFDHIHDSKLCTSYGEWNKTAIGSCDGRRMQLQSFSMLQPCGIDRFNGVEFVCCPNMAVAAAAKDNSESTEDEISAEISGDIHVKPIDESISHDEDAQDEQIIPASAVEANDPFSVYVNRDDGMNTGNKGHKWNEHDYFVKAMEDMRRHHEDKINQMMKDWAAARQRVQELKSRDSKAAEKLNKEITARFQKTYDALEVENVMERKQLSNLHQQRVQSELNEKKRRALDDYMQAIDDNRDPTVILQTLKQYIKVVQKDRLHTINRYKHLRDTDPAEAERLRPEMADHLRTVDQQMTLALEMLDRVPRYKKKIQLQIDAYLDAYHTVDASVNVLLRSLVDNPPTTVSPPRGDSEENEDSMENEDYGENEEEIQREEREEEENEEDEEESEESEDENDEVVEPVNEQKKSAKVLPIVKKIGGREDFEQATVKPVVITVDDFKDKVEEADKSHSADADEYEDEDEDNEEESEAVDVYEDDDSKDDGEDDGEVITPVDESATTKKEYSVPSRELDMSDHDFLQDPEPAHVDKSYISAKESYISKTSSKAMNHFNAAVPIGITVGAITILVVIIVGVVVMRQRANRRSLRAAVNVRLDPAASPEERHIASMQMTGYENPTYKYFEQSGTATA